MFPRIEEIGMKKPRYIQLSDEIRNMILNNEYQYGEMFPPERELETTYEMDRKTIRKALNILVEEGLLTRIKGKGTFVNSPDINYSMRKISGFGGLLEQQGIESTAKVISVSEEQAGYRLGKMMEIGRAEPVWKMIRQRFAKGEPLALEITYVKQGIIPDFANMKCIPYMICIPSTDTCLLLWRSGLMPWRFLRSRQNIWESRKESLSFQFRILPGIRTRRL